MRKISKGIWTVLVVLLVMTQTIEVNAVEQEMKGKMYEQNGSCKNVALMDEYMEDVPDQLIQFLSRNGWTICLTTEDIAKTEFDGAYKSVLGVTIFKEKTIKIEDRKKAIKESLYHEIGHALDGVNTKSCTFCTDSVFQAAYEQEKSVFVKLAGATQQTISDCHEYFAECVNQYYTNAKNFKKKCPESYAFVKCALEEVTSLAK